MKPPGARIVVQMSTSRYAVFSYVDHADEVWCYTRASADVNTLEAAIKLARRLMKTEAPT